MAKIDNCSTCNESLPAALVEAIKDPRQSEQCPSSPVTEKQLDSIFAWLDDMDDMDEFDAEYIEAVLDDEEDELVEDMNESFLA